jgi:hypothetical protein
MIKRTSDLTDKSKYDDISRKEKANILQFFWLDVYHNLVDVNHTHIYIRGLGTFETRLKKLKELKTIIEKKLEIIPTQDYTEEQRIFIEEDYKKVLENTKERLKEMTLLTQEYKEFKKNDKQRNPTESISEQSEDMGRIEEQNVQDGTC